MQAFLLEVSQYVGCRMKRTREGAICSHRRMGARNHQFPTRSKTWQIWTMQTDGRKNRRAL